MRRALFIVLALLPSLLVLILAEAVLRYYHAPKRNLMNVHRKSSDPVLIYELVPGSRAVHHGVTVEINSAGFRDNEFPEALSEDTWRIVLLGDSVAWGWGVPMAAAFPQILEGRLRELRPRSRGPAIVYNLSVTGYSTEQEIRLLETRGLALQPNLIIISYVLNDPAPSNKAFDGYGTGLELVDYGRRALTKILGRFRGDPSEYHHLIHARHREQTVNQFRQLGAISRSQSVPILVALIPVFRFEPGKPYAWQDLHDFIKILCQENGLAFLDLYSSFRGGASVRYGFDIWHPNGKGHALIAQAIADYLRDFPLDN